LAFELTRLGYVVQGNEFSLYMLLASDFILNGAMATPKRPLKIYPWLLESRNSHSSEDITRSVDIPDVDPWQVLCPEGSSQPPEFSMAAGDFVSIYNSPKELNQWDCVACCFFLDAVPSVVEYLQLIHSMLKPGGILVNFGPLLFHWSGPPMRPDDVSVEAYRDRNSRMDERYLNSVDLCYDDIRQVMINVGFEIVEEQTGLKSLYTADKRSMMNTVYRCVSFVARKLTLLDTRPERVEVIHSQDDTAVDEFLACDVDIVP
jgi:carnosine N-methyltransferase